MTDDDFDKTIMLFARLIARQRELLARLSRDIARQEHQQIERELKEIVSALDFLDASHGKSKKSPAQIMMGGAPA
jgi:hypothetical protein